MRAPSLRERIDQGGVVGYVIIGLGALGFLIAIERIIVLTLTGLRVRLQARNPGEPKNNALGRILKVYHDNPAADIETLELKLSEAILKETPRISRMLMFLKIVAVVAPLLGLLGTVTGMIITFQAITLFGTGDPKLMAGGISQALVTTVLGLCVAIPHGAHAHAGREPRQAVEPDPGRAGDGHGCGTIRAHAPTPGGVSVDGKALLHVPGAGGGTRLFRARRGLLMLIAILTLVMWSLIVERLFFLTTAYPSAARHVLAQWEARPERVSWHAHRVREYMISTVAQQLERNMMMIQTCIALCPLMGLLGTVTGMIEVFEVMAISGSGNPRSMASGVSKATVPTMAGMSPRSRGWR